MITLAKMLSALPSPLMSDEKFCWFVGRVNASRTNWNDADGFVKDDVGLGAIVGVPLLPATVTPRPRNGASAPTPSTLRAANAAWTVSASPCSSTVTSPRISRMVNSAAIWVNLLRSELPDQDRCLPEVLVERESRDVRSRGRQSIRLH